MKQRKETGAWAWVIFVLLFVGGIVAFVATKSTTITVNNNHATSTETVVDTAVDVNEEKLEEIRSREEIRRQQELLVKETFLKEEKSRITSEKEAAISDFDAQIAALEEAKKKSVAEFDSQISTKETELEQVRSEKIDFQ